MTTSASGVKIRQLWPLLFVEDLARSVAFYQDQLGFSLVGRAESEGKLFWCRLERGGASLMLEERSAQEREKRGRGVGFYFVCDDADAMYRELSSRGIELEPRASLTTG